MKRDMALAILGAWMLGIVIVAAVAMQNFHTIDRLLEATPNAAFERGVEVLDGDRPGAAREFLRYLSSELNRLFFVGWGLAETVLGVALTALVWNVGPVRLRVAAMALLALTVVLTFAVTPPIVGIGRALDFVPRDPPPPELAAFGWLHAAYSIGDGLKLVVGVLAAVWIVKGRAALDGDRADA